MSRYHEMDALRAVAMLLGIVLHASLFLIPNPIWPIQDAYAQSTPVVHNPYIYLISAIHGFRMQLFFLISGFFTALLWQRRGLRRVVEHRLERIALPLALGGLTIVPITIWLIEMADFNPMHWPLVWLDGLIHLWFLLYLLLLGAAFAIAVGLGAKFVHPAWGLVIPLTFLPELLMEGEIFGADYHEALIPDPNVLGYYALFFVFGVFLYQRGVTLRRWWATALPVALVLVLPAGVLCMAQAVEEGRGTWAWGASAALQAAYAWLMCFGMIGLFRWVAARERFWVRYMSDSSYWLYLWHLPLVLVGQRLLVEQDVDPHLKLVLLCVVVTAILLFVYQLGVRYTWIGTMLNGRRVRHVASGCAAATRESIRVPPPLRD